MTDITIIGLIINIILSYSYKYYILSFLIDMLLLIVHLFFIYLAFSSKFDYDLMLFPIDRECFYIIFFHINIIAFSAIIFIVLIY